MAGTGSSLEPIALSVHFNARQVAGGRAGNMSFLHQPEQLGLGCYCMLAIVQRFYGAIRYCWISVNRVAKLVQQVECKTKKHMCLLLFVMLLPSPLKALPAAEPTTGTTSSKQ